MASLQDVQQAAATLSVEEKRELAAGLPPPTGQQLGRLWYILIVALAVLAFLAGLAAYSLYSGVNKDAGAVFLAVTTTIVGGLIGLLAPSPVNGS